MVRCFFIVIVGVVSPSREFDSLSLAGIKAYKQSVTISRFHDWCWTVWAKHAAFGLRIATLKTGTTGAAVLFKPVVLLLDKSRDVQF